MATVYRFDPVKAAEASALVKTGIDPAEALGRVGVPEDAWGAYQLDDLDGSPTRGQVVRSDAGAVTVYNEEEQKARADARKAEAVRQAEQAKQERQQAGPAATREKNTSAVADRPKPTPEYEDYLDKLKTARERDRALETARNNEYIRSKGYDPDTISFREKIKVLSQGRNEAKLPTITTNQDAVGAPPGDQYTDSTVKQDPPGGPTTNTGELSPDQAAATAAVGQTAVAKLQNESTPNQPGVPVSEEEKSKLDQANSGSLSSKVEQSQDPTAANKQNNPPNSPIKSEANFDSGTNQAAAKSVQSSNATSNSNQFAAKPAYQIPTNVLHDYASYTYRITLFLLTKKDYNALAADPTKFIPTFSLISSGGGFASPGAIISETTRKATPGGGFEDVVSTQTKAGRHPDFQTDFFIDNLSMTTIVGLNAKTKASNAVEIGFDITEPYGLSLLDRLLSACETSGDNNPNYMAQPYLLQVDLLASPTDEKVLASSSLTNVIVTKKIAIKLLEMKIKPSGSGSTYSVRAMPFNHTAFNMTAAAMPVSMSVEASTVGEFFSSESDLIKVFAADLAKNEERLEQELQKWIKDNTLSLGSANKIPTAEEIKQQKDAIRKAQGLKTTSLAAAYNAYMQKIATEQKLSQLPPTKIAFNVPDDEIAKSPIVDDNSAQSSNAQMTPTTGAVNAPNPQLKKTEVFNINAGTSIVDVIDQVMSKSQYIKSQLKTQGKDNNDQQAKEQYTNGQERTNNQEQPKPLKWYKIVPTVALNDFDASRNDYSKTILYSILPYTAANAYHPNFPKATAQSAANSVVREYNYLYTGKNKDIQRIDIDFDSTFYTQLTTYQDQLKRLGTNRNSDSRDVVDAKFSFNGNSQQGILPQTVQYVSTNRDSNSMNSATNPEEKVVGDLKKSLYTSQRGDMLNIKINITGDPAFIKQDDVFYNPGAPDTYKEFSVSGSNGTQSVPVNPNTGQIIFDAQQVYVKVNFKNAIDIDDTIGIVNKQEVLQNGRRTDGTFTGVYKVLQVSSQFSRGQFTQTLDLIRMPDALPKVPTPVPQTTQSGTQSATKEQTESAKRSEESDASKKSAISRNPAGVATPASPALVSAASQPAVNNQAAPTNANNAQNVAPQNTSGWSFSDAFRQARKDFGNRPGGVFEWRGKLYQTNYQNEPFVRNPTPVYPGANQ